MSSLSLSLSRQHPLRVRALLPRDAVQLQPAADRALLLRPALPRSLAQVRERASKKERKGKTEPSQCIKG